MGQRGRFARTGSGDDQQGAVRMTGGGPLLLIQFGQNGVRFVGNRHWRGSSLQFLRIKPISPPPRGTPLLIATGIVLRELYNDSPNPLSGREPAPDERTNWVARNRLSY